MDGLTVEVVAVEATDDPTGEPILLVGTRCRTTGSEGEMPGKKHTVNLGAGKAVGDCRA